MDEKLIKMIRDFPINGQSLSEYQYRTFGLKFYLERILKERNEK